MQVKIPKVGTLTANTFEGLAAKMRDAVDSNGYGASDVGSVWTVKTDGGENIGTLSYNGRYTDGR